MPDRIIRANILTSDAVNQLSWPAEVFFRRLMSIVDDYGRHDARLSVLRAMLYSLKLNKVSEVDIGKWMEECVNTGLVSVYSVNDKIYLEILKFGQRLRAMKSRWPENPLSVNKPHLPTVDNECGQTAAYAENELESESEPEIEERNNAKLSQFSGSKLEERSEKFRNDLVPFIEPYGKELIGRFFDYWREPNKSRTKMKWELENTWDLALRLKKWASNDYSFARGAIKSAPDAVSEVNKKLLAATKKQ